MSLKYELSALFSKGQLLQIGDIIDTKEEFLDCIGVGFENIYGEGYISKIISEPDVITNSGYLNIGLTYCTNYGLGNKIYLNNSNKSVYAFECKLPKIYNYKEYINKYFNITCNRQKREYLLWFLDNKLGIKITNGYYNNRLGHFLFKYAPEIYKYLEITFKIRSGSYGEVNDKNLSDIIFTELRNIFGNIYQTNNIIYLLTSSKSEFTNGKLFIKGKEKYYETI